MLVHCNRLSNPAAALCADGVLFSWFRMVEDGVVVLPSGMPNSATAPFALVNAPPENVAD